MSREHRTLHRPPEAPSRDGRLLSLAPAPAAPLLQLRQRFTNHGFGHLVGSTFRGHASAAPLASGGEPLAPSLRAFFEPRFGMDFTGVRVHAGGAAAESARAVSALAYTVGRDVVFGAGQYRPETEAGRRLLAHELTHVVQQDRSPAPRLDRRPDAQVPRVGGRAPEPLLQRTVHEGNDHGGRYEIDDRACTFAYHQNWFFIFQTNQTQAERTAYMEAARRQVEEVWSNKFPLIPDGEKCACHPGGFGVAVVMHPHQRAGQGRGFTIVVTTTEQRGFTNQPIRQIDLGTSHDVPVSTGEPGGQRRIAHEFGHTIGLTDEYHGWAGLFRTEGSRDQPSIMHSGDEVRPRHYQHFADLVNQEIGAGCTYSPGGRRLPAYENPPLRFGGLPFSFLPSDPELLTGIVGERRLGNAAILGLAYPTAGGAVIWNPRDQSAITGPTVGLRLNQLAHPLYLNVRTGVLFDPQRPGSTLALPLSVDLGIRHDSGLQVGVNYTAIGNLLGSGGWTHLVGLGLQYEH